MTQISTSDDALHLAASAADLLAARARLALDGLGDPLIERRLRGPEGLAWSRLVEIFQLSAEEAELLGLSLAVAIEPALGDRIAELQGAPHKRLPGETLTRALFDLPARPIWRPSGRLASWRLLRALPAAPGEATLFEADPRLVDWMHGAISIDSGLALAFEEVAGAPDPPAEWRVAEIGVRLREAAHEDQTVRLCVAGPSGSGRMDFAAGVLRAMGLDVFAVDPAMIPAEAWTDAFIRAQRFALYADCALIWREGAPDWPEKIPLCRFQAVCTAPDGAAPARRGLADLTFTPPEPGAASAARIWRALAPWLEEEADRLAATPGVRWGDIRAVAAQRPPDGPAAEQMLRARARARIGESGRILDPRFSWEDLVLPEALTVRLRRIAFEARMRPRLMESEETRRLFGLASGLAALFSGPPGVGKSMAAQVVAHDLGVNLLTVDLAATFSKYIGETAKSLSRAFEQAKRSGAALVFEEADAFFTKRTDVRDSNDRYANADTNHLLHLLEGHEGLVILSTNRRGDIDPAFVRRLRHIIEFTLPGPEERRRLWTLMLQALGIDPHPLDEGLDRLAATRELSPAQIKSAVLTAVYTSLETERPVAIENLDDAAALELGKAGRPQSPAASRPRRHRSTPA